MAIIGEGTFADNQGLKSIKIPSSVQVIEDSAFSNCQGLTNIEIPSSVTMIGGYVFKDCKSLAELELPGQLMDIGRGVFEGCDNLRLLRMWATIPPYNKSDYLGYCEMMYIYVPMESGDAYKTANGWKGYGCNPVRIIGCNFS